MKLCINIVIHGGGIEVLITGLTNYALSRLTFVDCLKSFDVWKFKSNFRKLDSNSDIALVVWLLLLFVMMCLIFA
jgi:hypothetical protein